MVVLMVLLIKASNEVWSSIPHTHILIQTHTLLKPSYSSTLEEKLKVRLCAWGQGREGEVTVAFFLFFFFVWGSARVSNAYHPSVEVIIHVGRWLMIQRGRWSQWTLGGIGGKEIYFSVLRVGVWIYVCHKFVRCWRPPVLPPSLRDILRRRKG